MRLLKRLSDPDDDGFSLVEHFGDDIPPYAILSHTWGDDGDEVTFKDLTDDNDKGKSKPGYRKLRFCGRQAKQDGLNFFWVDTCCIDKSSSAELSEALNSMYCWYQNSVKCYVYLSDVSVSTPIQDISQQTWTQHFQNSRWFKRGWTLQELLAPSFVYFYSKEEHWLGDKLSLLQALHSTTGIPLLALQGSPLSQLGVDERMHWMKERETKRGEDMAYSLLGIFDIYMPLIYGEGQEKALARLRRKIDRALEGRPPPTTLPIPSLPWIIPFRRDNDFIERDSLDRVCRICGEPAARAALVGLGGVGKSQIAIEYTYRVRDQSPTKWVFWVHAGTRARFEEGYRNIAKATKMSGWDDPKTNILRLVHSWLCDASNGQWTMVVDNADDADVFFSNTSQSRVPGNSDPPVELVSEFLPQSPNGSILITSRDQQVAWKLVGRKSSIYEVNPMDPDNAIALLEKKLGSDISRDEALCLINALDSMPLALSQAAAFITQRAPRMSVSRYVEDINKSDQSRAHLLTRDEGDIRRDGQASNSVFATWQISFDYIRKHTPTAARLLSFMSMFDRQNIPESLLINKYADSENGECDFDDDIHMLFSFSLVKMNVDGREFEMHRLVQISTKKWLELNDELETWKANYAIFMNASFPEGTYENWPVCRALLPHAQAIVSSQPQDTQAQLMWATVLYHVSWYLTEMGQYNTSIELNSLALDTMEKILGEEHINTLHSLSHLGNNLGNQGKYDAAEAVHKRVLKVRERILGPDHPHRLWSMANLALAYKHKERWYEAEEIYVQVAETQKRILGVDHPDTLSSMYSLALTYYKQERWQEAEELGIKVLEMRKKIFEEDHPDILFSMNALSLIYKARGRWQEAESLEIRALNVRQTKLGEDHPVTLTSMNNLAFTWWEQGCYNEALELMQKCVALFQRVLGVSHPHTIGSSKTLDDWTKKLAGHVPTADAREEIEGSVTIPDEITEPSTREPTDSTATKEAREEIKQAVTISHEATESSVMISDKTARTPARGTVTKKRKNIAVRIKQSSISVEAKKQTDEAVTIMAEGQIYRPVTTSSSRLKALRDQSASRQT